MTTKQRRNKIKNNLSKYIQFAFKKRRGWLMDLNVFRINARDLICVIYDLHELTLKL